MLDSLKTNGRRVLIVLVAIAATACGPKNSEKLGLGDATANGDGAKASERTAKLAVYEKFDLPTSAGAPNWRDHFTDISKGAILIELEARRLSYWAPGGENYREFPVGVPRSDDLERTGTTRIVRRRKLPDWRPTPSMIKRNPKLPRYIGPGPKNPLGERALYLGWRYYAIHGTNMPSSVGRRATSGCIRLFPAHIKWLFDQAEIGTPVKVVNKL